MRVATEEYYKLIKESGKHLANSRNVEGAVRGVYLDNITNKPCGAGEFVKVKIDTSSNKTGLSGEEVAAIGTFCAVVGFVVAEATPYVIRWAKSTFVPWIKQTWTKIRDIPNKKQSPVLQLKSLQEPANEAISLNDEPIQRESMPFAAAQKELIDAYILILSGYTKAKRIANANIILPSGEIVENKSLLLNQVIIDQINAAIKTNPSILTADQHTTISSVLGYSIYQNGQFHPITVNAIASGITGF